MDNELSDSYESPRSRVARLLEEIDEAPTPSPNRLQDGPDKAVSGRPVGSRPLSEPAQAQQRTASNGRPLSIFEEQSDSSEDEVLPTLQLGRAARRMLAQRGASPTPARTQAVVNFDADVDDLYDATPSRAHGRIQRLDSPRGAGSSHCSPEQSGLFVSLSRPSVLSAVESDDDLPDDPLMIRPAFRAIQQDPQSPSPSAVHGRSVSLSDPEDDLEKILSDATRPTRKASKKAMLEMERETQRLAREQALAHQMQVKKKFTKVDLFARLGFRQTAQELQTTPSRKQTSSSTTSASPRSIDGDHSHDTRAKELLSTPPSSPPTPWDAQKAMVDRGALSKMVPVRQDSLASLASLDEDKATHTATESDQTQSKHHRVIVNLDSPTKARDLATSRRAVVLNARVEDRDDLEIMQPMPSHLKAFDRVKPTDLKQKTHSKALHVLKHLAHLNHDSSSNGKKNSHVVIDPVVINAQLMAQAKAQARKAQQERMDELKAKGVIIMSVEEQEREAEQLENLLENARREADELRKKERAAAKRSKNEASEDAAVASDDEDEEWNEDATMDSERSDAEASDEEEDAHDAMSIVEPAEESGLLELEAHEEEHVNEGPPVRIAAETRRARRTFIVEEDEDEDEEPHASLVDPAGHESRMAMISDDQNLTSTSVADDPFAAFGFDDAKPAFDLMSPTQAFRATMHTPSQYSRSQHATTPSMGLFEASPCLNAFPGDVESQSQLVPASQGATETQPLSLHWESHMPETPLVTLAKGASNLTDTPGWEPSQDAGLPSPWTAARKGLLFATDQSEEDHDTQSTVRVRISQSPEVIAHQRRGRLTKGVRHVVVEGEDEDAVPVPTKQRNAFSEMQKRRLESLDAGQRAEAEKEMRNMLEEQAEESEDEYAGLGGDDSNMIAPETAEDRAMIDESNIEIGEDEARKIAQFYAEKQRKAEEEATSKLYKDITTGALRRRQGVGWELDEDEDDIAARRRQMRQREEARRRKLLLQDENVKGLLEGKGNTKAREAFLRTIGDDDDGELEEELQEDDANILENTNSNNSQPTTIDTGASTQPLREISPNKRPRNETDSQQQQQQPSSKIRRVYVEETALARPTSALQIRQSLSFLLDEPAFEVEGVDTADGTSHSEEEANTDSDVERDELDLEEIELARQNDGGFASNPISMETLAMPPPPRPADRLPASQRRTPAKATIIDRLSLRRGSSSSNSSSGSTGWSAWSTGSGSTSRAPSLLRRATSNLSATSNANERGVSYGKGAANANERGVSIGNGGTVGGNKKSSLAYQARAEERRLLLERSEKQRLDGRRKIAALRRQQGAGLGRAALGNDSQWE